MDKNQKTIMIILTIIILILMSIDIILFYSVLEAPIGNRYTGLINYFPLVLIAGCVIKIILKNKLLAKSIMLILLSVFNIFIFVYAKKRSDNIIKRAVCANAICDDCNDDICECSYEDEDGHLKSISCTYKGDE